METCSFILRSSRVGIASLTHRRRLPSSVHPSPSSVEQRPNEEKPYVLSLYQFDDPELANLESILVRLGCGKVHMYDLGECKGREKTLQQKVYSLLEVLKMESVQHKLVKKISLSEIEADVSSILGDTGFLPVQAKIDDPDWNLSFEAAALLLRKEGILAQDDYRGKITLEFDALDSFVRLDSASISSLNLLAGANDRNKEASLQGVLDRTLTKRIGTQLLRQWIRQPLVDAREITQRQNRVETLVRETELRESLRGLLKSVPDLDSITRRMAFSKGTLEDLYVLYMFANRLPEFLSVLNSLCEAGVGGEEGVPFKREQTIAQQLLAGGKFGQFKEFVEQALDLDLCPREFLIRPEHDESGELGELSQSRSECESALDAVKNRVLQGQLGDLDPKWETDPKMIKTHGHHFRIHKKHHEALKRIKNGVELVVVTACIRWSTQEMQTASSALSDVISRQKSAQAQLAQEALAVAASFISVVEMSSSLVAELDVLASFAHVAATCPKGDYTRPIMDADAENCDLIAIRARHPCLELQEGVEFVPNSHEMKRDSSRLQILTGPNMGGKSTFAKQLGVLCVMAQIGSFIPCDAGARLPILDAILCRVGAGDAQLRGISTFMAEMIEAANIVKSCTNRSLVIIDELGRGTSTNDGFGLAWAICEFLCMERKFFCIFATHFNELTVLAGNVAGACNLHVAALVEWDGKVTMLHEVRQGKCDDSYGVNIAKVAGFPTSVVDDATRLLNEVYTFKDFAPTQEDLSSPTGADDASGGKSRDEENQQLRKRLREMISCI